MAQDVSASAQFAVQAKLMEMFSGDTPVNYQYKQGYESAKAILGNNAARTSEVLVNGQCIGEKIYWLEKGADSVVYDGDGTALTLPCDLTAGEGVASNTKTYDDNVRIVSRVEVDDNLCNNLYTFAELGAERLKVAIFDIRKRLNTKTITFLDANKGLNFDPEHVDTVAGDDGITYTAATKDFTAAGSKFQDPDFLTDIRALVENNDIDNYFLLSGRWNFYNAFVNSNYHRLNDTEKHHMRFDDFNMHFDSRHFDSTLTGKNTFAIGAGTYAIWNRVWSTPEPVQIKDNSFEFHIIDPDLMINVGGVLQPVKYEVYYQRICTSGNTNGKRTFIHRWEVKFLGGLHEAPTAVTGQTGILKFKQA